MAVRGLPRTVVLRCLTQPVGEVSVVYRVVVLMGTRLFSLMLAEGLISAEVVEEEEEEVVVVVEGDLAMG